MNGIGFIASALLILLALAVLTLALGIAGNVIIFSLFNVEVVLMRNRYRPINHEQAIRAFIDLLCNGTLAH